MFMILGWWTTQEGGIHYPDNPKCEEVPERIKVIEENFKITGLKNRMILIPTLPADLRSIRMTHSDTYLQSLLRSKLDYSDIIKVSKHLAKVKKNWNCWIHIGRTQRFIQQRIHRWLYFIIMWWSIRGN